MSKIIGATVGTSMNPSKLASPTDEQIETAVNKYLGENPLGAATESIIPLSATTNDNGVATYTLATNTKCSATISADCAFVLPSEVDTAIDNAILVYANFKEAVSVIWGDVLFYGETVPEITEGPCDIIFAYNPTVKKWCVGITGDSGASGGTGTTAVGISNTEINDKGELVITYTDGTTKNLGSIKGADGKDGKDGTNGANGKDGVDGSDGQDGYTPVKGVDYWTETDKAEINADNVAFITTELAKRGQLKPEFAQSVEACTDQTKLYVLPDGYIYGYMKKTVNPTNQLTKAVDTDGTPFNGGKGWKTGYYLNPSGGAETESTGYEVTGYIPYTYTQTFRAKNLTLEQNHGYNSIAFYDKDKKFIKIFTMQSTYNEMKDFVMADGTLQGTLNDSSITTNMTQANKEDVAFFRIGCISIDNSTVITVDEPLESDNVTDWHNTGHAFVPADYEDRIIELEEKFNEIPVADSGVSLNSNTCSIFRKVVCCGDSMTAGYINIGNGVYETNEDYAWPSFMARLTGNEYINCGASGATVLTWQTTSRGLPKAQTAGVAQAYLVGLGVNDTSNVELGTSADIGTDNQTYYGGMSKIIRELNAISPQAKIFLQTIPTNSETRQAYNEAVRAIVEAYKDTYPVHLLDLEAYKSLYFVPTITNDSIGGHYTAIAYQQFAENLRVIWSKYINSHISDFQDVYSLPCD